MTNQKPERSKEMKGNQESMVLPAEKAQEKLKDILMQPPNVYAMHLGIIPDNRTPSGYAAMVAVLCMKDGKTVNISNLVSKVCGIEYTRHCPSGALMWQSGVSLLPILDAIEKKLGCKINKKVILEEEA